MKFLLSVLIKYTTDIIILSHINFFSPLRYIKIVHLVLNNNFSLTLKIFIP
jgi:hypothetical protein